jgi:hypothetical protein
LLPIPADRILTRQITKYDARRSSMSAIDTPAASDTASRRDALAADEKLSMSYDFVYIHEALHDMSYPVETLRACRSLLVDGGSVVIGDERVADAFTAPGDDLERFYYGFSVLHCLPVGMVGEGAAGTGTVMRAKTVKSYSEKAGFGKFEILPIKSDFYRFYRITP